MCWMCYHLIDLRGSNGPHSVCAVYMWCSIHVLYQNMCTPLLNKPPNLPPAATSIPHTDTQTHTVAEEKKLLWTWCQAAWMQLGATGSQSSLRGEMRASLSAAATLGSDALVADRGWGRVGLRGWEGVAGETCYSAGYSYKGPFVIAGALLLRKTLICPPFTAVLQYELHLEKDGTT